MALPPPPLSSGPPPSEPPPEPPPPDQPLEQPPEQPPENRAPLGARLARLRAALWRLSGKLGFRITFLLALALLPLALLSGVQTVSLSREAQGRAEAAILGETVRAAAPVLQHILRAQGAAKTLASAIAEVDGDPVACHKILARFSDNNPIFSLVGFIPTDGLMTCSGDGRSHDFNENPAFRDAMIDKEPRFEVAPVGPFPGSGSLIVVYPVTHRSGVRSGLIMLAIPQHALEAISAAAAQASGPAGLPELRLFTFDGAGDLLTASDGLDKDRGYLPREIKLSELAGNRSTAFTAMAANGRPRIFAVAPIVAGKFYALGSWPANADRGTGVISRLPPLVLPALMAVVSLFAAWMAAESLVLRHIRHLRREIVAFASGGRTLPTGAPPNAPSELREVEESFSRMAETLLREEAELEDALHQKEVLLREVHHRIKNNLQLIASIMNLQMRREREPKVRAILKTLQDRVMSLATIHRGLYMTTGVSDVRADELLSGIVTQVLKFSTGPGRDFTLESHYDEILLGPDQAVPLSLLLTEALGNAMKYGGAPAGTRPRLVIELYRRAGAASPGIVPDTGPSTGPDTDNGDSSAPAPDRAELCLRNTLPSTAAAPGKTEGMTESSGFGSQLIEAFARQLGGRLETGAEAGEYHLRLSFEIAPLRPADPGAASAPAPAPTPAPGAGAAS